MGAGEGGVLSWWGYHRGGLLFVVGCNLSFGCRGVGAVIVIVVVTHGRCHCSLLPLLPLLPFILIVVIRCGPHHSSSSLSSSFVVVVVIVRRHSCSLLLLLLLLLLSSSSPSPLSSPSPSPLLSL